MKSIFKPLSSFFGSSAAVILSATEPAQEATEPATEPAQETTEPATEPIQETTEPVTDPAQEITEPATESAQAASMVSISQEKYEAFIGFQAELEKFGKTAEDRSNFLADAGQMKAWYQNAVSAGVTPKADASSASTEKSKEMSKITKQAKEAYDKSAARKKV